MSIVIPAILEKEWLEIEKKLGIIQTFSKTAHIDIIDGKFTPYQSFIDPEPFGKFTGNLFLEAHLMVDEPVNYLESFYKAGFKRCIGQIEKMSDQAEFVAKGQNYGEIGLAVDLLTTLEKLKVSYEDIDVILLMCVKAGQSGQKFDNTAFDKLKELINISKKQNPNLAITVDGGIDDQTIVAAKNCGANRFIANSFIFDNNPQENYQCLLSKVNLLK